VLGAVKVPKDTTKTKPNIIKANEVNRADFNFGRFNPIKRDDITKIKPVIINIT
jgi:hypothetical protein